MVTGDGDGRESKGPAWYRSQLAYNKKYGRAIEARRRTIMEKYRALISTTYRLVLVVLLAASLCFVGMMWGVIVMQRQAIDNVAAQYDSKTGVWGWVKPDDREAQAAREQNAREAEEIERKRKEEAEETCKKKGYKAKDLQDCIVMGR